MPSLRKFRQKWFGLRIFHFLFSLYFYDENKTKNKSRSVSPLCHIFAAREVLTYIYIYIFLNASMGFLVNNKNYFRGNFSDLAKIFAKFACLRSRWPHGNCQHSRGLRGHDNDYAENYGQFWRLLYYFT